MRKWKVLTATGLILWGVLMGASRVHAEEIIITDEVKFWTEKYGAEYNIAPEVLQAIVWMESRCDPLAQSPDKSCKGLMQIKPACHRERMDRLGARNVFGV